MCYPSQPFNIKISFYSRCRRPAASWSRTRQWASTGRPTIGVRWTPPLPTPTYTRWDGGYTNSVIKQIVSEENNSIIINTLKFNDIHYDKFRYRKLDIFVLRFFPESTKIDGSGSSSVDPIGLSSGNGPSFLRWGNFNVGSWNRISLHADPDPETEKSVWKKEKIV